MLHTHALKRHSQRCSVMSIAGVGGSCEAPCLSYLRLRASRPEGEGMWNEWASMPELFIPFITMRGFHRNAPGNSLENLGVSVSGVRAQKAHKLENKMCFCWEIWYCNIVGFTFQAHSSKTAFFSAKVFCFGSIYRDRIRICWNCRDSYRALVNWELTCFFTHHLKLHRKIL